MQTIDKFQGEHRWLSNFWPAKIQHFNLDFPSVENAYQASKTTDPAIRMKFQNITPGQAKRLGRQFPLRDDWHRVKYDIMADLVWRKFQNPILKAKLLATGDAMLIEGNTWHDSFWGVCDGVGKNLLGKILMMTRDRLRN